VATNPQQQGQGPKADIEQHFIFAAPHLFSKHIQRAAHCSNCMFACYLAQRIRPLIEKINEGPQPSKIQTGFRASMNRRKQAAAMLGRDQNAA
jgi:hypothetical protein